MADGINGQIDEQEQAPLLVIADDNDEDSPALGAVEEEAALPAPAVEDLTARQEAPASVAEAEASAPAVEPAPPAPPKRSKAAPPAPTEVRVAPVLAASAPLPQPGQKTDEAVPPPAARRKRISPFIPLAAVSLAVFASSVSVIGLLVASRTVAETQTVLRQVQAHQSKMRHLDTLIDEIDGLRKREQIALIRLEQINVGKPATGMEVRSAISGLQLAMAKYQPSGSNGSIALLRDGQAELAERVGTMYRRIEQINEKMDKLAGGKTRTPEAR